MTLALALLGSTGSIGRSTIEVVRHHPERLRVATLAAFGSDLDRLGQAAGIGPHAGLDRALGEQAVVGDRSEGEKHEQLNHRVVPLKVCLGS